ncbi:MAG TPA: type I methionyl aminopeptidase [Polyangia bacterium]|jgi:methionyl aminopeptidase|nr:type I methionyl aminopeptidase [Polyangia bacterium]
MAIALKSPSEIAKLREANLVVAEVLDVLESSAKAGMTTWELNEIAAQKLRQLKADSAFLGYHGYPAVLCTSVNEVVVHGIPRKDVVLQEGDLLSIDFGAFKDGWCGDSARTIPIGQVSKDAADLMTATRESLERAITQCVAGNRLGDIGWAVQSHVEPKGFSVVRQFVGHGIGRAMHEEPHVPNYGKAGNGRRLSVGLVVAIEPMINAGSADVLVKDDGWTAVTKDGSLSAHFEHSVAVTDNGPVVLSRS